VEGLRFGRRAVAEGFVQAAVVEPADVLDDGGSSWERVRRTRLAMSSVLKLSAKLSASALSKASPTDPTEAGTPWSASV
jgi:hypothetical protein